MATLKYLLKETNMPLHKTILPTNNLYLHQNVFMITYLLNTRGLIITVYLKSQKEKKKHYLQLCS